MRINRYVALSTGLSRRKAEEYIRNAQVTINGTVADLGRVVAPNDTVMLSGRTIVPHKTRSVALNKPEGYVVSRSGQGSKTIYDLLPAEYQDLKPVGRLDKNSSGLLLLTNDGEFANRLTHPRYAKNKTYEVDVHKPLTDADKTHITDRGVQLDDGLSKLMLAPLDATGKRWQVTMSEGRNRQIRRTFNALGYRVMRLHRTAFGPYLLGTLNSGKLRELL